MNKTIKMSLKGTDGKTITKDVPVELYSNYKAIGWEEVKLENKENKKFNSDRLDKIKKDNENL